MKKAMHQKRQKVKMQVNWSINLAIFREGRMYVAYAPALDLVAQGRSMKEVQKNFEEVFDIYFEETIKKGTLGKDLMRCGWHKRAGNMEPPALSTLPSPEKLGKDIQLTALAIVPLNQKNFLCPALNRYHGRGLRGSC